MSADPLRFAPNRYTYNLQNPLAGRFGIIHGMAVRGHRMKNNLLMTLGSKPPCPPHKTYECKTTSKTGVCGPKIDALLKNTLHRVKNKFNSLSFLDKIKHCAAIYWPTTWDIDGLTNQKGDTNCSYAWLRNAFPKCGSGNSTCSCTVSVGGQCFHPYTVNYVLFGVMNRLCLRDPRDMAALIAGWKLYYGLKDTVGAVEWAMAGYWGLPNVPTPSSSLTATCQDKCNTMATNPLCSALGNDHFKVWWAGLRTGDESPLFVDCV